MNIEINDLSERKRESNRHIFRDARYFTRPKDNRTPTDTTGIPGFGLLLLVIGSTVVYRFFLPSEIRELLFSFFTFLSK